MGGWQPTEWTSSRIPPHRTATAQKPAQATTAGPDAINIGIDLLDGFVSNSDANREQEIVTFDSAEIHGYDLVPN